LFQPSSIVRAYLIFIWNNPGDLRKGKTTWFGNFEKPYIGLCKVPITGPKTLIVLLKATDTVRVTGVEGSRRFLS